MTSNKNLHKAKSAKNDEFYTQLVDVEKELQHYTEHFKDKVILCNCNDSENSAFWQYFYLNFSKLGLKKLVCTAYNKESFGYKLEYMGKGNYIKTPLTENGDFRSQECIKLLRDADIVVTNPPFSLFREFVDILIKYEKKFIVWGNNNAVTYKEIFPLIRDNKVWLGYMANQTCVFRLSNSYNKWDDALTSQINDGHKYGKCSAISVFTSLEIEKHYQSILLRKVYSKNEYPKYDNYKAINVNKTSDIPCDYTGIMGVPITFLCRYNPNQFEIIGRADGNISGFKDKGGNPMINGAIIYKRILIRRKDNSNIERTET